MVARLAEGRAVEERLVAYATAIDTKDWSLLGSCFTTTCRARYLPSVHASSREEIVAVLAAAHEPLDRSLHRLTNVAVALDGSLARATAYVDALLVQEAHPGGPTLRVAGWYEDVLMPDGDTWLIADRTFRRVWAEGNEQITTPAGRAT